MKPSHILAAAAPLASLAHARQARRDEPVSIYTDTTRQYDYYGCYNETTQVEGGANTRALSGGSSLVKPGEMTVPMCLEFCAKADDEGRKYRYAGVEWSRYVFFVLASLEGVGGRLFWGGVSCESVAWCLQSAVYTNWEQGVLVLAEHCGHCGQVG